MKKWLDPKILLLAAVWLAASASLLARGNSGATDGKIVLSMYNQRDKTAANAAEFDIVLEQFYAENPNVRFEIEELFGEPWHQKLQAMAASGQLPDIVRLFPGKRTGYVTSRGLVKDLRPWLGDEKNNFLPMAMTPQGPNGEIYELPVKVTVTHVMFANERLLAELGLEYPQTIGELYEQAAKINAAGYIPVAMSNKDGWQMQSTLLSVLVERTGGMKWLDGAVSGKNSFTEPEFVSALDVIKQFVENKLFPPGINQLDYPQGMEMFVREKAVYYIDGAWKTEELVKVLTEEQKDYVSLNVIPALPKEKGRTGSTTAVAGTGFGMNSKLEGAKADIAWDWIWTYSGPVGSKIHLQQGMIPAYKMDTSGVNVDKLIRKQIAFESSSPMGYVIDNMMDQEGMGVLQPLIQELMFGSKTSAQVAASYEAWVAENDSGRQ